MSVMMYENTWQENQEMLKTRKVAIVPVGSNEQHGPALPVGTDWIIAEYLAKKIGEKSDKGMVVSVIPYGHALYHNDFCGTLAVSQSTLRTYTIEICEQLVQHGFTHILFINAHGGNNNPLFEVGQHFRLKNIPVANIQWYEVAGTINHDWSLLGHGDITETAVMLHINPEIVRMDRAQVPVNKKIGNIQLLDLVRGEFEGAPIYLNLRTKDVSDSGALLEIGHSHGVDYSTSPADATAEMGKGICEAVVDYAVRFIDEFVQMKY